MYLLSICIPSFNREKNLKKMLDSIDCSLDVEVVVCDDGSTDNTRKLVLSYSKKLNIRYIYQENSGVSAAISRAYHYASGLYVIKMDSDDRFTKDGLKFILESIKKNSKYKAFVYGIKAIKKKKHSLILPPNCVCNFISLRADFKIKGDLKEVVMRKIVLEHMYFVPKKVMRIPPSLLWIKIAENHNCLSFEKPVAIKNYLDEGISSKMFYFKTSYPETMVELYKHLSESKVYKSFTYRWRSRLLWMRYNFHNNSTQINKWWHWIIYIISGCIYLVDRLRLTKNKYL